MPRVKIHIDKGELQAAIDKVMGGNNPPQTLTELHKRVGELLDKPPGSVLGRMADYGITANVQPKTQPKEENSALDLTPFTRRGIVVESLADMLTSSLKDDETNRRIMSAIVEIRKTYGVPNLSRDDFHRLKGED